MARLRINLFGLPQFTRDNTVIHLERRKAVALLSYLAVTAKPHSRDALATLFWPDHDQSGSRANLRRELSRLKADLGTEFLSIDRDQVQLNRHEYTSLDVEEFQELVNRHRQHEHESKPGEPSDLCDQCVRALVEAVSLYSGDFMSGFSLPDSQLFDEWQFFQSEGLRQKLSEALQHLIRWFSEHGDYESAIEHGRRWLSLDPMHEPAHRELMRLYALSGKQSAALRQYQDAVRILEDELGVEPEQETVALYEAIRTRRMERPAPYSSSTPEPTARTGVKPVSHKGLRSTEKAGRRMEQAPTQQIAYTRSPDGVRIAYSTVGTGPVLVKTANWLSHLEYDWQSPVWKHWMAGLLEGRTLIRYDERGCGLSDWGAEEISLDAFVRDLETVVDTLGLERFPLLGISQGGPVSIAYAVRHPERVSRLILYGTYARGRLMRKYNQREVEMGEVLLSMIKLGWGKDNPAFRQFFTTLFMPEASPEQMEWFNDLQKVSTSSEVAARLEETFFHLNVSDIVSKIAVPTLVVHGSADGIVPYQEGRWLAEHIPDASFITLKSKNHILLESEPAWGEFLGALRAFLDEDRSLSPVSPVVAKTQATESREVSVAAPTFLSEQPSPEADDNTGTDQIQTRAYPPHNLPHQLMPFVGRETELAEISQMLSQQNDCRLLTITGSGGIGKTRLAIEAVSTITDRFTDGVWFISLQSLASPEEIAPAIFEAIQFNPSQGENPQAQLAAYLADKSLLLILDNFDHMLAATELVQYLLDACRQVKILVTSRQVLNLRAEWVYPLRGLPFPVESDDSALDGYASIQLFIERARRSRHDFNIHEERSGVVQVCKLLEGLPLAIELAASWTRNLSASQIANEIKHNLDFLEVRFVDIPEKHRSLLAVFDQSWRLLTREEQSVYKRLSAFRGGFTWRAARHVASASLPVLNALADKSLLTIDAEGRYQVQELLRQFAEEQLSQSQEELSRVDELHGDFYANYIAERLPGLLGGDQLGVLEELKGEWENIRKAWQWALEKPCVENLNKVVQGLHIYYQFQSRFAEALQVFERAASYLETQQQGVENLLAGVLVCKGWMSIRLGKFSQAEAGFEQALKLYERSGDLVQYPLGLATDPVSGMAVVAGLQGRFRQAVELGERSLMESADQRNSMNMSFARYALTSAYLALGEPQRALDNAEAAYQMASQNGNRWFMAYCLNEWGKVVRVIGRYAEARQRFLESFSIRELFNDPEGMAVALNHLGQVAILEGEYLEAKALFQNALSIYQDLKDRGGLSTSLAGLGAAALGSGDYSRARKFFHDALEISTEIEFYPQILAIMLDVAVLFADSGHLERGVELLAIVKNHPSSEYETQHLAADKWIEFQGKISAERVAAAESRAEGLELSVVARSMLQKL